MTAVCVQGYRDAACFFSGRHNDTYPVFYSD